MAFHELSDKLIVNNSLADKYCLNNSQNYGDGQTIETKKTDRFRDLCLHIPQSVSLYFNDRADTLSSAIAKVIPEDDR